MPYNETTGVEQPDTDEPATPRTRDAIALAGVPPLTGTPGDIEAASQVRVAKLRQADEYLTALRGGETLYEEHTLAAMPPPAVSHAQVQAAQAALNRLRHHAEAAWWLAHQSAPVESLLAAMSEATQGGAQAASSAFTSSASASAPLSPGGAAIYAQEETKKETR